jgi:microcystin-dependent protein
MGATGGGQTQTLTLAQIPTGITSGGNNSISVNPPFSNTYPATGGNITNEVGAVGAGSVNFPKSTGTWGTASSMTGTASIAVTSNNTGGNAHPIVQPTIVCNYIIRIL